jgi:hypothetical protein
MIYVVEVAEIFSSQSHSSLVQDPMVETEEK